MSLVRNYSLAGLWALVMGAAPAAVAQQAPAEGTPPGATPKLALAQPAARPKAAPDPARLAALPVRTGRQLADAPAPAPHDEVTRSRPAGPAAQP